MIVASRYYFASFFLSCRNVDFATHVYSGHPDRPALQAEIIQRLKAQYSRMPADVRVQDQFSLFETLMPLEVERQLQSRFANIRAKVKRGRRVLEGYKSSAKVPEYITFVLMMIFMIY